MTRSSGFTDRPYPEAGQLPVEEFLSHWWTGEKSVADDAPNADFTCTVHEEVVHHVVELTMPLSGDRLSDWFGLPGGRHMLCVASLWVGV